MDLQLEQMMCEDSQPKRGGQEGVRLQTTQTRKEGELHCM